MPDPLNLKDFTRQGDYYDWDLASDSRGYRLSLRTRLSKMPGVLDYKYTASKHVPVTTVVVRMRNEKVLETDDFRKALDMYNQITGLDQDPVVENGDKK